MDTSYLLATSVRQELNVVVEGRYGNFIVIIR
jgi:hypothetical protein